MKLYSTKAERLLKLNKIVFSLQLSAKQLNELTFSDGALWSGRS